jgi:hypothetical protein
LQRHQQGENKAPATRELDGLTREGEPIIIGVRIEGETGKTQQDHGQQQHWGQVDQGITQAEPPDGARKS